MYFLFLLPIFIQTGNLEPFPVSVQGWGTPWGGLCRGRCLHRPAQDMLVLRKASANSGLPFGSMWASTPTLKWAVRGGFALGFRFSQLPAARPLRRFAPAPLSGEPWVRGFTCSAAHSCGIRYNWISLRRACGEGAGTRRRGLGGGWSGRARLRRRVGRGGCAGA